MRRHLLDLGVQEGEEVEGEDGGAESVGPAPQQMAHSPPAEPEATPFVPQREKGTKKKPKKKPKKKEDVARETEAVFGLFDAAEQAVIVGE